MNIKLHVFKLCALMFVLTFLNDVTVCAGTLTLSSNADNRVNSSRQAILNANSSPGADIIDFNFASVATITLTTCLLQNI